MSNKNEEKIDLALSMAQELNRATSSEQVVGSDVVNAMNLLEASVRYFERQGHPVLAEEITEILEKLAASYQEKR